MSCSAIEQRAGDHLRALARLQGLQRFGVRLGLTRLRSVLASFGDPQRRYPSVHLAGTNGKGSTAAMIASCLGHARVRCGLFTSPHLHRFSERIVVDGQEMDAGELASLIERVIAADPELTFFEVASAVAMTHFAEQRVECGVFETGLGGRLDATNVLNPDVVVLTRIAIDHADVLGNDLASIAAEKAGIIKPDVPVVAALPAEAEVRAVIERRCGEQRAALTWVDARGVDRWLADHEVGLAGEHQRLNAALCLGALERLGQRRSWRLPRSALQRGLRQVRWPGRLETIERRGSTYLLDCAHNPDGAASLARSLGEDGSYALIFGHLEDKPAEAMLSPLLPHCSSVILTRIDNRRSADPARLAAWLARQAPDIRVDQAASAGQALARAGQDPRPKLVAGSIYLVGEIRALLLDEPADPLAVCDPLGTVAAPD